MPERVVEVGGLRLWTESFGSPDHPPVLLIMGAGGQAIDWPDSLVERLVAGARFVIRFDNRDSGLSTAIDFSKQPYNLEDLAADALGILDAYGIESAHFVGVSMGGMIGQVVAIQNPERARSLTAIMSSPTGGAIEAGLREEGLEDLPGPSPHLGEWYLKKAANMPQTREEHIQFQVELFGVIGGSTLDGSESVRYEHAARAYDRTQNRGSMMNHGMAVQGCPDRRAALRNLSLPCLVIHGTEDPVFPHPHGVAIADAVPGAKLLSIEGMGHAIPDSHVGSFADRILAISGAA